MTRVIPSIGRTTSAVTLISALLGIGGCMVGTDFEKPAGPDVTRYGETPDPRHMASPGIGGTQTIVCGADLPADWWALFHSRELDLLVRRGLAANPTVTQAEAALREAQALTDAARAGLYPTVTAGLARSGTGTIGSPGSVFGLYGANVSAIYTIDLFGGIRRGIEAQAAAAEAAAFQVRATELALTANIIASAIEEASLTQQIDVSEATLRRNSAQLQLVKVRNEAGAEPIASVLTQESILRSEEATIVVLQNARTQTRHRLAALTGDAPSRYDAPGFTLAALPMPRRLPVRLPSQLVEQRPDIRVAEAELHAAAAEIGVATANLFPTFTIDASLGANAASLATLAASNAWATGLSASQTLVDGGALEAKRQAAIAAYDAALAAYKQTVLTALQNTADALSALSNDAKILTATMQAEDLARRGLAAAEVQYRAGALTYADLLISQTQYASATIIRVQAQAQRVTDTAALFEVLGGGWMDAEPRAYAGHGP